MAYNYCKLLGRIVEKFSTQANFAKALGISERSLSLKLTNKVPFKQPEITRAAGLLGVPGEEIPAYFLTLEVQRG